MLIKFLFKLTFFINHKRKKIMFKCKLAKPLEVQMFCLN